MIRESISQPTPHFEPALPTIPHSQLPPKAQAKIVQEVFHREAPRKLCTLLGIRENDLVIPKTSDTGATVPVEEEAAANKVLQEYEMKIIKNVVARFFQPTDVGEAEVTTYLEQFPSPGAREDREALLAFFTAALMARGFPVLGGKNTLRSAIIADGILEAALADLRKAAPHNLHNILLLCNPQRLKLMESKEQLFSAVSSLTKLQMTELSKQLFGRRSAHPDDGAVRSLVTQWSDLQSAVDPTTAHEMEKELKEFFATQHIDELSSKKKRSKPSPSKPAAKKPSRKSCSMSRSMQSFLKKTPAPMEETLKIGKVLSTMVTDGLLPTLLPRIIGLAATLFSRIPITELGHPELWEAKMPRTEVLNGARHHVEEYLGRFETPEREERKAALDMMTEYLRSFLPLFFDVLKTSPALFSYLIPVIQEHIVDNLDRVILPPLHDQCPIAFHNLLVNAIDPHQKTILDSFAEFQIDLFKLTNAERLRFAALLEGKEQRGSANAQIHHLLERWASLERQDHDGILRSSLMSGMQQKL